MPVSSLEFSYLGPFDEVSFEFDPRVNVLVGPNNCGKTTVLLALADILLDKFELPARLLRGAAWFRVSIEGIRRGANLSGSLPVHRTCAAPTEKEEDWIGADAFKEHLSSDVGYRTFVPALRLSTEFRAKAPGSLCATTS